MKKDKEWLIKRVENYIPLNDKTVGHVVDNILDIIRQLDEPEALSQEFIDKHAEYYEYIGHAVVPVDELQNLLAPKQEELKSKIQKLIEAYKKEVGAHSNLEKAWIDGFITDLECLLEEEQRYYVKDIKGSYILAKIKGEIMTMGEILEFYGHESVDIDYNLTEQEIKDYDSRYWAFAAKAEEMEE